MRLPSRSTNLRRPGFPALQHLNPTPSISASRRRTAVNLGLDHALPRHRIDQAAKVLLTWEKEFVRGQPGLAPA